MTQTMVWSLFFLFSPHIQFPIMGFVLFILYMYIGFLLGTRQTILETKDGGNTWTQRSIPSAEDEDFNYRFNSISFKGKEGWIVGKPAILLYTSDAGESWERIPLSAQLPGDMVSSLSLYIIVPANYDLHLNLFCPILCTSTNGYFVIMLSAVVTYQCLDFSVETVIFNLFARIWILNSWVCMRRNMYGYSKDQRFKWPCKWSGFLQVYIKATGEKSAEMVTDQGAIYVTSNRGYNWRAAVQETVSATLNRCLSI